MQESVRSIHFLSLYLIFFPGLGFLGACCLSPNALKVVHRSMKTGGERQHTAPAGYPGVESRSNIFPMARRSLDAAAALYPCTISIPRPVCVQMENRTISLKLQMPPVFMSCVAFCIFPRFRRGLQPSVESEKAFVGVKLGIVPCSDASLFVISICYFVMIYGVRRASCAAAA